MKKILITGVNGLLGQNLVKVLAPDAALYGVDLGEHAVSQEASLAYRSVDLTNQEGVKRMIEDFAPEVIIHGAAMTNVDLCETEQHKANAINHLSARYLIESAGSSVKTVLLSSDYVFDGKRGPYTDEAEPNPISWYGETKLRAEKAVLGLSKNNLVVRTMVLVGKAQGLKPDFIHFVRSSLTEKKAIRIVTDQVGNITLAASLARNIKICLENNIAGVISLSGGERFSRYDIAVRIAERYQLDKTLISEIITADLNQPAKRPLNSGFVHNRAKTLPQLELQSLDELLTEYDHE